MKATRSREISHRSLTFSVFKIDLALASGKNKKINSNNDDYNDDDDDDDDACDNEKNKKIKSEKRWSKHNFV